ncbi:TPA: phage head closure protein [Providencia alcalifaciens]|uniref:phage head closure protein n=1 Tax=Providencia alcalifaciens TaxID=126385 RepID=UPI0015EB41BB|nr:phage head closure protein [Providencia alcalifaciens]QLQ96009.1 phage head closure protein [Providencia alcalifaciens]
MKAGELNKRIWLSRIEEVRDELGVPKSSVVKVKEVWAKSEAMSNRKIRTADQQQVIETYQFTIRPRSDVNIGWIITYQNRNFTVRAVDRNQSDRLIITTEADNQHDRN